MALDRSQLDARIAGLETALAADLLPDEARVRRVELVTVLATRYARFGGGDDDRLRAERLAQEVLADEAATAKQRQLMTMVLPTLTMLTATPAAALRDHPTLDMEALRRTEQWRGDTDATEASAGLARLVEQLDAIDSADLPPEVRWSLDMVRTMSGLLGDVQRPDWDGTVKPEITARLHAAASDAPVDAPGVDLVRGLASFMDPGSDPTASLESAIAGLTGDNLLRPVLQRDLARALIDGAGPRPAAVLRATELLEQARAGMVAGHPMREETGRMLAGALVVSAAVEQSPNRAAAAQKLVADLAVAATTSGDPAAVGAELFLSSLVGLLQGMSSQTRDVAAALDDLVRAIALLPGGHPLRPVAIGQLGAVLADRQLMDGLLADGDTGVNLLRRAEEAVALGNETTGDAAFIGSVGAVARIGRAVRLADADEFDAAAAALRRNLANVPTGHPLRPNLNVVLAGAELSAAVRHRDDLRAAASRMRAALSQDGVVGVAPSVVATLVNALDVLSAMVDADPGGMRRAIDRMETGLDATEMFPHQRAGQHALLGKAHLAAGGAGAVTHLEQALELLGERRSDVMRIDVLRDLALAHRAGGDQLASRRTALEQLMAYAALVLLQSGVPDALSTARGAVADAERLMRWCLADGDLPGAVEALELGRGLTLHAATTTSSVPTLLNGAKQADLAQAWLGDAAARRNQPSPSDGAALSGEPDYGQAADDVRYRVLDALQGTREGRRLFAAPAVGGIGRALEQLGRDALAYLVPGSPTADGVVLVVDRDGRVRATNAPGLRLTAEDPLADYLRTPRFDESDQLGAWRAALERLCAWAGAAAMPPLLEVLDGAQRVVLVPCGPLAAVPWQAARFPTTSGEVRYACQDLVLSTAASARQLRDVATRTAPPVGLSPLLVSGPGSDLDGVQEEIAALTRTIYPDATVLSHDVDSAALLVRIADGPTLIHIGSHATATGSLDTTRLDLATPLSLRTILEHAAGRRPGPSGPTVVLAACESDLTRMSPDEVLTLATAFLAAGASAVVGARWPVSDQYTAVAMFALHHFLAVEKLPAADALRAAQLWMLDPDRALLPGTPLTLRDRARRRFLGDLSVWAAFGHHGW
ncbi:CHAT domain-containing protein [Pseudonocardia lacus]|uniref:CHAT domain-containing protein n=1 Tax=Pseudonocardia lacus TaxID=2835865 RepID=UPI001BDD0EE3|nr:CHAT domain-containing protein [Pseudonocardia lacus]